MRDFQASAGDLFSAPSDSGLPKYGLRSSLTSILIHIIALALFFTVPYLFNQARKEPVRRERIAILVPPLKPKTQPTPPPVARVQPPKIDSPKHIIPRPVRLTPPKVEVKKVEPTPQLAKVPSPPVVVQPTRPQPPAVQPVPAPPAPFGGPTKAPAPAAAASKAPGPHVGDFGDAHGVHPSANSDSSLIAKVGGFDEKAAGRSSSGTSGSFQGTSFGAVSAAGSGTSKHNGSVATGGFGDGASGPGGSGSAGSGPGGSGHGSVSGGGFGDAAVATAAAPTKSTAPSTTTPVEIISKPKPPYTEEARALKIEGDVSLEVLFTATGEVQVIRVVHGLGHGLDEVAARVAREIRFRPSTRNGVPVDSKALIRVTFELA